MPKDPASQVSVKIDEALTRRVAELARLELSDEEVRTFTGQLRQILGHVDQLQELAMVDEMGKPVEPLVHPIPLETPLREDAVVPFPRDAEGRPKVLDSAPDVLNDGFKVPQIV